MPRTPHHEARPEVPALARQLVPAAFLLAAALVGLAFEADGRGAEARDALRWAIASGTLNHDLAAVAEQHLRP